ncbi:ATP-binding protein [Streptomyces sp. NPDC017941]|uniref:ATP-binding protein n=1 Tax=Streptomyces sp. NPDC017941 TaxID=3365018 RepID=UPI0037A13F89
MSHLRAPAARADRREGGRHGRSGSRAAPPLPETRIRPQLLRIAVLPAVAVGLCGTAAVLALLRADGTRPAPPLLGALAAAAVLGLGCVAIAAVAAERAARSLRDRVLALRRATARGQADLCELVEQLRRGDAPPARGQEPARHAVPGGGAGDGLGLLAEEMSLAHDGAVTAVVQAAQLSSRTGSEQKVEVFVNLARRLQSLVHREISLLDDLENTVEDPELLKGLFHIDHLATRIRRHAENLAVLGGAMSRRQWSRPVTMTEVLRSSIAEVEQYSRVKLVPPIEGTLRGHVVADVIHLLAELVENATVFSAPHTQVLLRANLVTAGLAVEVEDRGLGMPLTEQSRMNRLLADPDQVNVASLLQDGRIGLFVVSALARRHGIAVRLQTNIYGGVQAVLIVPQDLLGAAPDDAPATARAGAAAAGPSAANGLVPGPRQEPALPATATPSPYGVPDAASPPSPYGTADPALPPSSYGVSDTASRPTSYGVPDAASPPSPYGVSGTAPSPSSRVVPGTAPPPSSYGVPDAASPPSPYGAPDPAPPPSPYVTDPAPVPPGPHPPYPYSAAVNGTPAPAGGGAPPAPLPVREPRDDRPTPAEAVPGIRAEDRQSAIEHTETLPVPLSGPVRGRVGRPQLPRRRAQEHLAPQLRDLRAPRPQDDHVGHDPGLMAAFQRGIGLAQAAEPRAAPAARSDRGG